MFIEHRLWSGNLGYTDDWDIDLPLKWGREKKSLPQIPHPDLPVCEYATFLVKRDFADVVKLKILERLLKLSGRSSVIARIFIMVFPYNGGSDGKWSACNAGDPWVQSLGREDPLEKEWLPTSVFLPGEFHGKPMGLQRVGHHWVTNTFNFFLILERCSSKIRVWGEEMW